jgi:hypothetical protein
VRIYQPDLFCGNINVIDCIKAFRKELEDKPAKRVGYFAVDTTMYDQHKIALRKALKALEAE